MPKYTTALKVQQQLGIPTAFSNSTTPSLATVNNIIEEAEDYIDQVTQHSWKSKKSDIEFHDIKYYYRYLTGVPINLKHRQIKPFDATKDDMLRVWNGSSYEDLLSSYKEGRGEDYWIDYERGIVWLRSFIWLTRPMGLQARYRYGGDKTTLINKTGGIASNDTTIPVDSTEGWPESGWFRIEDEEIIYTGKTATAFTGCTRGAYGTTATTHPDKAEVYWLPRNIERIATKLACVMLIENLDDRSVLLPEGTSNVPLLEKAARWREEVNQELETIKEFRVIETQI